MSARRTNRLWGVIVTLLIGACSPLGRTPPTPTPTLAHRLAPTSTFPPTWTPTFPPPATPPRTATPPETLVPTRTVAELCEDFAMFIPIDEGHSYGADDIFGIVLQTEGRRTLRITLTHRLSGDGLDGEFQAQVMSIIETPLTRLPRPGLYDWSAKLVENDAVICEVGGFFFVGRPEWLTATPTPTVTSTPTITDTPTEVPPTAPPTAVPVNTFTPSPTP